MALPISALGAEWRIPGLDGELSVPGGLSSGSDVPSAPGGASFGSFLSKQVASLDAMQDDAAKQSQAVADGTAQDPTSAVMAIERARLAMQLASQIRTKSVEAINDVFHTQV